MGSLLALPDTMDKAVWLGEIAIRLVEKEEHRKAFIEFMTEALNTLMEDLDCRDSEANKH